MCLDTVGKTVTLKKDKVVWKFVHKTNKTESSLIAHYHIISNVITQNLMRNRTTLAIQKVVTINNDYSKRYTTGFHCFTTKQSCQKAVAWEHTGWEQRLTCTILDYIIPAGTIIRYGRQWGFVNVVTPVLINPRVPEDK